MSFSVFREEKVTSGYSYANMGFYLIHNFKVVINIDPLNNAILPAPISTTIIHCFKLDTIFFYLGRLFIGGCTLHTVFQQFFDTAG